MEFRTSSNSTTFDGSLSHVGEFAIASGYADTTRLECGGVSVCCVHCVCTVCTVCTVYTVCVVCTVCTVCVVCTVCT